MNYAKELQELLRPLGIYEVDSGISGGELISIGAALDEIWSALERVEREALPLTAEDVGLVAWETLLPFVPASRSLEERRSAVAALLRIDGASFTPTAINGTLAGCGIPAAVRETGTPQTLLVVFPGSRGIPEDFEALRERIEQILPCHLALHYAFAFLLWTELEEIFSAWAELDAASLPWAELELLGEAEP